MTGSNSPKHDCVPSYKLLGDFWALRIINELRDSEKRFSQIERILNDINTATLSKRLAKLQADGVIIRKEISRADVVYSLTERGKLVLPVLDAMDTFALEFDHK